MITKRAALSPRRAEARDNAIEHLLDRARGEHGKRLAALYHALTAAPRTGDSKHS
jgi:hypothetical protein